MSEDMQVLTAIEATTLDDLEQVVEKGLASFVEVGKALERIRDRRLYRATHGTFEDYLRERWKISRAHAYRQIEAATVAAALSPVGDIPTERVARELAPLKDDPEKMRKALQETVEQHGPKPTAKQVREVVAEHEDPRGDRHEQVAGLSKAKRDSRLALANHAAWIGGLLKSGGEGLLDDLELVPNFDWDQFLGELREGRREMGRLIREIEQRRGAGQ